MELEYLKELFELIKERKEKLPEGSYTSELFKKGNAKIAQKLGEEATETVVALCCQSRDEVIYESADLIYHLFVALVQADVDLKDVIAELKRRRK